MSITKSVLWNKLSLNRNLNDTDLLKKLFASFGAKEFLLVFSKVPFFKTEGELALFLRFEFFPLYVPVRAGFIYGRTLEFLFSYYLFNFGECLVVQFIMWTGFSHDCVNSETANMTLILIKKIQ